MVGEAAMEIVIPFLTKFLLDEIEFIGTDRGVNINNIILFSCLLVAAAMFAQDLPRTLRRDLPTT